MKSLKFIFTGICLSSALLTSCSSENTSKSGLAGKYNSTKSCTYESAQYEGLNNIYNDRYCVIGKKAYLVYPSGSTTPLPGKIGKTSTELMGQQYYYVTSLEKEKNELVRYSCTGIDTCDGELKRSVIGIKR